MHALSLPTWVIHIASVLEWGTAMALFWQYGWRTFTWAMIPALGGAMCAITWHFFDNDPALRWLVTGQAGLTLLGNCALWWAAWNLMRTAKP
ncbi:MAG: DUF2499 domain-containing protein [Gloeomargarita sp. SKYG116]|nr:DUF2499 domain-containing protein [Gloeomargarita sp. SKYG116]MDW8400373.1 DUF2499 domain-containing protein [Gloeomargarita sp. SKYGB_i_bin116]